MEEKKAPRLQQADTVVDTLSRLLTPRLTSSPSYTDRMMARTSLLLCLLAASSYAFAVQQPATFAARSTALKMSSGGSSTPPPPPAAALKPPPALYEGAVAAGAAKAAAPFGKIFKLGCVAGAHIAFGAYLAITVGGACPGIASTNPGLQKVSDGNKDCILSYPIDLFTSYRFLFIDYSGSIRASVWSHHDIGEWRRTLYWKYGSSHWCLHGRKDHKTRPH